MSFISLYILHFIQKLSSPIFIFFLSKKRKGKFSRTKKNVFRLNTERNERIEKDDKEKDVNVNEREIAREENRKNYRRRVFLTYIIFFPLKKKH